MPAPILHCSVLCYVHWEGACSTDFDTYEEALAEYERVVKDELSNYSRVELVAVFKQEAR